MKLNHPFDPIYNKDSKILILGSFPSIKSREINFYYGHPRNRFWKILENVFDTKIYNNIENKISFLLNNNIALWDTIKTCDIHASSDASIKNVEINDITSILKKSKIEAIFCNGNTSYKIFKKYYNDKISLPIILLPSSSPANAKLSLDEITNIWKLEIKKYYTKKV